MQQKQLATTPCTNTLRFETEFVVNDIAFSKFDDKGLLGITSDTFETK
jgi:hypothetical protein